MWINYSLLEFCVSLCVCVSVCVCILCYCERKWQSPSTTSRPHIFECINSVAIANASPMPIIFLWKERWRETETWGDSDMGRWGGRCVQGWGGEVSHHCMSLSLLKTQKKYILNVLCALESLCMRNFKIPLTPLFFPPSCVQQLQTVTQLFPWQ